ncbi:unnamed protein product [Prorocentrum cordatum]|uniref:SET domain-containing protein n=1 Tax=Prorocentrum cordatum TaxID=2364126 RepID=A0ABN9STL5_9DINO|nr:unnamed protein product [Polarella glacialis]
MLAAMPPGSLPAPPEMLMQMFDNMPAGAKAELMAAAFSGTPPAAAAAAAASPAGRRAGPAGPAEQQEAWEAALRSCCARPVVEQFQLLQGESRRLMLSALQAAAEGHHQEIVQSELMRFVEDKNPGMSSMSDLEARRFNFDGIMDAFDREQQSASASDPLVRAISLSRTPTLPSPSGVQQMRRFLSNWGLKKPKEIRLMIHNAAYEQDFRRFAGRSRSDAQEVGVFTSNSTVVKPGSAKSLADWAALAPISIEALKLFEVAKGRCLQGVLVVDPIASVGVTTFLEDSAGSVIQLGLYNQLPGAPTGGQVFRLAQTIFPKGTRIRIAEPFLKIFRDGNQGVRVDDPGDLIVDGGAACGTGSAKAARERGNDFVKGGEFHAAAAEYWRGLRSTEVKTGVAQLLSNRAQSFLKLELWNAALSDAAAAALLAPKSTKAWLRYASALEGLGHYELAERARSVLTPASGSEVQASAPLYHTVVQESLRAVLGPDVSVERPAVTSESADLLRSRGNDAYKDGDFNKAAGLYSSALAASDLAGEAAVLLGNISQCGLQSNMLYDSVAAAVASLQLRPGAAKQVYRLAKALSILGALSLAHDILSMADPSLGNACGGLRSDVEALIEWQERGSTMVVDVNALRLLDVPPPDWINQDLVKLAMTGTKGRGVVACKDVEPGQIIMIQRPRIQAEHGSVEETRELVTNMNSTTRLMDDASQVKLRALATSSLKCDAALARLLAFMSDGSGPSRAEMPSWDDLMYCAECSVLPLLSQHPDYTPQRERDDFVTSSTTVSKILSTNCHGSTADDIKRLKDIMPSGKGLGKIFLGTSTNLYPAISMLNHAAKSNCCMLPHVQKGKAVAAVLVAVAPIRESEELTITYDYDEDTVERHWGIRSD